MNDAIRSRFCPSCASAVPEDVVVQAFSSEFFLSLDLSTAMGGGNACDVFDWRRSGKSMDVKSGENCFGALWPSLREGRISE